MNREQLIIAFVILCLIIMVVYATSEFIKAKKLVLHLHDLIDQCLVERMSLRCPSCRIEIHDDAPREREFGLVKYYCNCCGHFTHAVTDPDDQTPYPPMNVDVPLNRMTIAGDNWKKQLDEDPIKPNDQ